MLVLSCTVVLPSCSHELFTFIKSPAGHILDSQGEKREVSFLMRLFLIAEFFHTFLLTLPFSWVIFKSCLFIKNLCGFFFLLLLHFYSFYIFYIHFSSSLLIYFSLFFNILRVQYFNVRKFWSRMSVESIINEVFPFTPPPPPVPVPPLSWCITKLVQNISTPS